MSEVPILSSSPAPEPTNDALQPTLLASLLPGQPALVSVRGALTPASFDAPTRETEAFFSSATVYDLGFLGRVTVRGEDRFRWLSGMVTNTVNDLAPDALAWNLVLSAQGRILGDLHVWRSADGLSLVLASDQKEKLLAHLDRFIIMDDVELTTQPEQVALGLAGPHATELLGSLDLPVPTTPLTHAEGLFGQEKIRVARTLSPLVPRFELWIAGASVGPLWQALAAAGAQPIGAQALESIRLAEAQPLYGIDIAERDLPQETSQLSTLNFNKGCYVGQEIVERIHARGQVHRHLRPLELDGPLAQPGTELSYLKADGTTAPAGTVTSAATLALPSGLRRFALAQIRAEAELRSQPLTYTTPDGPGAARILAISPVIEI
jgi:folate-binding protein YgfZ